MTLLDKYILKKYLVTIAVVIFSIALLFSVINTTENVKYLLKSDGIFIYWLEYLLAQSLEIITLLLPLATGISTCLVYLNLEHFKERLGCLLIGFSNKSIYKKILVTNFVIMISSFFIQDFIIPKTHTLMLDRRNIVYSENMQSSKSKWIYKDNNIFRIDYIKKTNNNRLKEKTSEKYNYNIFIYNISRKGLIKKQISIQGLYNHAEFKDTKCLVYDADLHAFMGKNNIDKECSNIKFLFSQKENYAKDFFSVSISEIFFGIITKDTTYSNANGLYSDILLIFFIKIFIIVAIFLYPVVLLKGFYKIFYQNNSLQYVLKFFSLAVYYIVFNIITIILITRFF